MRNEGDRGVVWRRVLGAVHRSVREKDSVEALLYVHSLEDFDQEWEERVDEVLEIEEEFSDVDESKDRGKIKLEDGWLGQENDEFLSGRVGTTDDRVIKVGKSQVACVDLRRRTDDRSEMDSDETSAG